MILTVLYVGVSSLAALSFVPQIMRLWRNPDLRAGLSLPTWGGFTCASMISLLYAIDVADGALVASQAMFLAGNGMMLMLALSPSARRAASVASRHSGSQS